MHGPMPPLNALRAFECAARHLSLTKAAVELHVTPGALSHQIRGLEDTLGLKLFERRVRSIALTAAGRQLYPGLQLGFAQIRDALEDLSADQADNVLVVSTPVGLMSKWLAPRLHRFSLANPEVDVRVASTSAFANFRQDGIDLAIRVWTIGAPFDASLAHQHLVDMTFAPVCSPELLRAHGPFSTPAALAKETLLHDDHRPGLPGWTEWFRAAGAGDIDVSRGHRFSSPDHALDVAMQGGGVFLAYNTLARDALKAGQLVIAYDLPLQSARAYYLVGPKGLWDRPIPRAFRTWIGEEMRAAFAE